MIHPGPGAEPSWQEEKTPMAWKKPNQLTGKKAKEALARIHEFFYADSDRKGRDFWNPDKEVSGGDFVEYCAGVFAEFDMVPEREGFPAQWDTKCPQCKEEALIVREAVLCATGERIHPASPLAPDGFDVDPAGKFLHLKDMSTEDEKVMCLKCKAEFDLSDLALD
jgi:hypothetical protein